MTRAVLFLCLTTFVLTHAAPEPSKRCCEQGPDCMNPCPEEPGAGLMAPAQPAPFMPAPEAPQMDCCQPGPTCDNPCPAPPPQEQNFYPSEPAQGQDQDQEAAPQPPPPEGNMFQDCCAPGPSCFNPCGMPPPPPPPPADFGMAGCCDPSVMPMCPNPCPPPQPPRPQVTAYAPYPGEITMKLKQPWKSELTDHASAAYQILSGNLATAIKAALRREAYVNNVYFREGYVPGNPSTQPITVAHFMVDGGSDDASVLQQSVTPDESMGDGLKVYKDSFNAY